MNDIASKEDPLLVFLKEVPGAKRFLQSLALLRTDDRCGNIIMESNMDGDLRLQKVRKTGTWYLHF